MSNTITPTVFYRTLNVEGLEIFYREAGPDCRESTHSACRRRLYGLGPRSFRARN